MRYIPVKVCLYCGRFNLRASGSGDVSSSSGNNQTVVTTDRYGNRRHFPFLTINNYITTSIPRRLSGLLL